MGVISLLTALNDNMKAMGESLKRFHVPTSGSAEAAKKPRRSSEPKVTYSSTDSMAITNPVPESGEDLHSEPLLTRPKDKHMIDEDDTLPDQISKQLRGKEETCGALPEKN